MSETSFTSPFLQHVMQAEVPQQSGARAQTSQCVETGSATPRVAQVELYPFSRLCALLDHLESAVNKQQQTAYLAQFWQGLRRDESFFPYMRLLLPQLDNERAHYQLRESKLARLYVDVLGLPHTSADAQRLLRWKDPSKSHVETTAFSDAICALLSQKGGFQHQGQYVPTATTTTTTTTTCTMTTHTPGCAKHEANPDVRELKTALAIRESAGGANPGTVDATRATGMTVAAINRALDDLANATDEAERRRVILHLVRHTSVTEQKWIVRIILRDTRIRMTHQSMLVVFHPSALDVFNNTNDLRQVCDTCVEDTKRTVPGSLDAGIFLFQPLRPMLASPISMKKLEQLLDGHPDIVAQPKYDGERIMIHMDNQRVMYWTRNAKNYTPLYGPNFDSVVRSGFPIGSRCRTARGAPGPALDVVLENVILDGEFLVYDGTTNAFESFGGNRTLALGGGGGGANSGGRNVFRDGVAMAPIAPMADGTHKWFCYMVFDMLMLNGTPLLSMPFTERQSLLRLVMTEEPKHIELVPSPVVHSSAEILAHLESAVKCGNEGIVLKRATSPYVPGERKGDWIKMKPDHIAGLADSLDLVVVGGYYGTKFGARSISHFLLATWANGSSASPRDGGARFHTFCKVGNGYTSDELQLIQTTLEPFWERTANRQVIPDWLDGWKPVGSDLIPDVYVHPRHSLVLEVFGYAFTDTVNYRAGYTIRFPRMLSIRWDKNLEDATDMKTLNSIREASVGALQRRLAQGNDELLTVMSLKWKRRRERLAEGDRHGQGGSATRRVTATVPSALPPRALAVTSERLEVTRLDAQDAVIDRLFDGYEFCVLFTSTTHCDAWCAATTGNRAALERCLLQHGAKVVANPGRRTSLLLASSSTAPKVANWVHMCRAKPSLVQSRYAAIDIAHCDWVAACLKAGQVLPLTPRFMIFTGPALQGKFATLLDRYEDSYTEPCSLESFRTSLQLALREVVAAADDGTTSTDNGTENDLIAAVVASDILRAEMDLSALTTLSVAAIQLTNITPQLPTQDAVARDPGLIEKWARVWLAAKRRVHGASTSLNDDQHTIDGKGGDGPKHVKTERDRCVPVKREASADDDVLGVDGALVGDNAQERTRPDAWLDNVQVLTAPYVALSETHSWSAQQLATIAELMCCKGVALCRGPSLPALVVDVRGTVWKAPED